MYIVHIMHIPCIKLWVSEIYDMVQTLYVGVLTLCNGKGRDDILLFTNYGDVGFCLDNGHELVALMHIGNHGSSNIRFGSMMACHFTWLLVVLVSTLHSGVKVTYRGLEGMIVIVVFTTLWFVCFLTVASILIIFRCLGCGCRWQGREETRDS